MKPSELLLELARSAVATDWLREEKRTRGRHAKRAFEQAHIGAAYIDLLTPTPDDALEAQEIKALRLCLAAAIARSEGQ